MPSSSSSSSEVDDGIEMFVQPGLTDKQPRARTPKGGLTRTLFRFGSTSEATVRGPRSSIS